MQIESVLDLLAQREEGCLHRRRDRERADPRQQLLQARQIKVLQSRVDNIDEDICVERGNCAKAEKNGWFVLSSDIGNMENRFEQFGFNTALQIEQNKKRKSDLAESNIAHEGILAAPRQKENIRISEFGEQTKAIVDRANMEKN